MNKENDLEYEDVLSTLGIDIRLTKILLLSFGVLMGIAKFLLNLPLPLSLFPFIGGWLLLYIGYEYLIKKTRNTDELYNICFGYNILDLFFITIIVHYLGGVEWIGAMTYVLTLLFGAGILPRKKSIALGIIAAFFYSSLVSLEYFGIISHHSLFMMGPGIYQSSSYVVSQLLLVIACFYFIADTSGVFSERIKEKGKLLIEEREKVTKAYREVEEAKKVLEIQVEARTKELKELTESLDEQVKARTQELQEKIRELEQFNKLAVGRELKMTELKEEIKNLKAQLESK